MRCWRPGRSSKCWPGTTWTYHAVVDWTAVHQQVRSDEAYDPRCLKWPEAPHLAFQMALNTSPELGEQQTSAWPPSVWYRTSCHCCRQHCMPPGLKTWPLHARLSETLEPGVVSKASALPPTIQVVAELLRELLHSHAYMSHRQRLVASLGGPKALSRLYVSYARLHLPSLASHRSPLAFPYGQLHEPLRQRRAHRHASIRLPSETLQPQADIVIIESYSQRSLLALWRCRGRCCVSCQEHTSTNFSNVADTSRILSPDHAAGLAGTSLLDFPISLCIPIRPQ